MDFLTEGQKMKFVLALAPWLQGALEVAPKCFVFLKRLHRIGQNPPALPLETR